MSPSAAPNSAPTGMPLSFTVPGQFNEISLTDDPEQRARNTYASFSSSFEGISPAQCLHMVIAQEMTIANLVLQGAVYVATCLARSETHPTLAVSAQFSVFVKEATLEGRRPLVDVSRGLRNPGEPREIIFNEFPAGEAVVIGDELLVRQPVTVAGNQHSQERRIRQVQAIFALPDNLRVAIFTMSSESLADWDHFVYIFNEIAHSVSFRNPRGSMLSNRLEGLG